MGVFSVKHGGNIRWSAKVSSSESTEWSKGRILRVDTSGELQVSDGSVGNTIGVAMENRVSSSTGPTTTLTKTGAPTGDRYSMILDDAVIVNDQLQSGVVFAAGDKLFASTTGFVTTSGNGTGSDAPVLGFALAEGHAGDSGRPLEMFWDVQY